MNNKRDFAEDQRICDAATAGPWSRDGEGVCDRNNDDIAIEVVYREDIRFIAEARTGWPAALEHIRVQDTEISRLRAVLERMDDRKNPMLPRSEMVRIVKEALDYGG